MKNRSLLVNTFGNLTVLCLVGIFLVSQIFTIESVTPVLAVLTVICFVFVIQKSKKIPQFFSLVMLIIGGILLLVNGAAPSIIIQSITKNLSIVCLIVVVPILAIPIHLGDYSKALTAFLSLFNKKPLKLYGLIYSFFYFLSPITNLGSLHIIHSVLAPMKLPYEFLSRLYPRAFSSINTWAPYYASVFFVLTYLKLPLYTYVGFGLALSALQFLTAVLLFAFKEQKGISFNNITTSPHRIDKAQLLMLLLIILLLISSVFFLELVLDLSVSVIIILTELVFTFIWSLLLGEQRELLKETQRFAGNILPNQSNEIALFLAAGFFSVAMSQSPISHYIEFLWLMIAEKSIFLLILATILTVALFAFLGIHQIVIISSILASISPDALGISTAAFAMLLLSSWAIASLTSPVAPMNVITANLLHISIFRLVFGSNGLYMMVLTLVHSLFIYGIFLLF